MFIAEYSHVTIPISTGRTNGESLFSLFHPLEKGEISFELITCFQYYQ